MTTEEFSSGTVMITLASIFVLIVLLLLLALIFGPAK